MYFVSGGTSDAPPSGHLLFRGGRAAGSDATHSYLAVPPLPGSLWLFPGAVPHGVLPFAADSKRGWQQDPRISIAINLADGAPLPRRVERQPSARSTLVAPLRVET